MKSKVLPKKGRPKHMMKKPAAQQRCSTICSENMSERKLAIPDSEERSEKNKGLREPLVNVVDCTGLPVMKKKARGGKET
jgi:hypothetical protein